VIIGPEDNLAVWAVTEGVNEMVEAEAEHIFRCCLCYKDGTLAVRTATLMRLDCAKHGSTLHQRWIKRPDGVLEPAEA